MSKTLTFGKQLRQGTNDSRVNLVATLLNKTTGALQQHLRLNARTLQTYAQVREVILEYHRSRLLMNPVAQTSANATFAGGASAPMDIGALAAALWKGKGKGKGKEKKGKGQGRKRKRKGLFEVIRKRRSTLELYDERQRKRKRKRRKTNF